MARVELSHPDKVLFGEAGLTKADLAAHYERVAALMLAHIADRPLSLQVFHQGVGRPGHFLKNVPKGFPSWVRRAELPKRGGTVTHVVADDPDTLRLLAQHNAVTIHAPTDRLTHLGRPDRIVIDLDPPGDGDDDWPRVRRAGRHVADAMRRAGLEPFAMVTGSSGLHVVAPLVPEAGFDAVLAFARGLAQDAVAGRPDELTTAFHKAERGGRVYVDVLRNRPAQTAVVPYAVRARPEAPVATPIGWDELGRARPRRWTVPGFGRRLAAVGDAWDGFAEAARSLP